LGSAPHIQADRILKEFRAPFIGKCSPVHLLRGALDLAVSRFSAAKRFQTARRAFNLPNFARTERPCLSIGLHHR